MGKVLANEVKINNFNFTEKRIFGSAVIIEITNPLARKMEFAETVFIDGFVGEVMNPDGIEGGASGEININPNRVYSLNQVNTADGFVVGDNLVHFEVQTEALKGEFRSGSPAGSVPFKARIVEFSGAADPGYIVLKPPYQNGDLVII